MTAQRSLFDAAESERRKVDGMYRAAVGREGWLAYARGVAVRIAREQGTVNADDVRAAGVETPVGTSPNIFGSIFSNGEFEQVGYTLSKRPTAHRNLLRVWRLRDGDR